MKPKGSLQTRSCRLPFYLGSMPPCRQQNKNPGTITEMPCIPAIRLLYCPVQLFIV